MAGFVSSSLIRGLTVLATWRTGFRWRSADVALPACDGGGDAGRRQALHFLEREPRKASEAGEAAHPPTLVLIPGLTMECTVFLAMVAKLNIPEYRIVIVELPAQGANRLGASPPRAWPSATEREAMIEALLASIGVTKEHPADILGYSLGGAILGRLLRRADFARTVRSAVLLAPALFECIDDAFVELMATNPRRVHAYETVGELRECFTQTSFGFYPQDMPPDFVLRGMVSLRQAYGEGYYTEMVEAMLADADDAESLDEVVAALAPAGGGDREAPPPPTLVIIGDRDSCVSPARVVKFAECAGLQCVLLNDTGHFGGPKGSTFRNSILTLAAPHVRAHLLKHHADAASASKL